jgi:hypothetical protein
LSTTQQITPIIGAFLSTVLYGDLRKPTLLAWGAAWVWEDTSMGRLTAKTVEHATRGFHPDGDNLYLDSDGAGGGWWLFRFKLNGRERYMGLGPVRDVPLARARQLAADARRLRAEGVDPIEERNRKRAEARLDAARTETFAPFVSLYCRS